MASKDQDRPLVAIAASSPDETDELAPAIEALERLGCPYEVFTGSLWTDPRGVLDWAEGAEQRGVRVILAAAIDQLQLPALLAAACRLPVLAIPAEGDEPRGEERPVTRDAAAAPVASLPPGGGRLAALLAVRILATGDARWCTAIDLYRAELASATDGAEPRPAVLPIKAPPSLDDLYTPNPLDALFDDAKEAARPVYDLTDPVSATAAAPLREEPPAQFADDEDQPVQIRPFEINRPLSKARRAAEAQAAAEEEENAGPPLPPARKLGRLRIDCESPDFATIEDAVDCLLEGGVIAFPTETVYGLAADATNPRAVARLFALKEREKTKAISLMVDSSKLLAQIACNVTVEIRRLMEAFWPGAMTLVFLKRPGNFRHVSDGDTIGVRLPDHSVPLAIMQALSRPLACTSANLSGQPEARSADAIEAVFGERLDLLLDGGELPERPASTVLDVSREPYRILRQGAITASQISAVVGDKLENQDV